MLLHTLPALFRLHELKYFTSLKSREDVERAETEKARCRRKLAPEPLRRYEVLEERYGKTALVPVKNSVCTGCFIRQPGSGLIEVGEEIYQCQHCGRLLYRPEELYEVFGL